MKHTATAKFGALVMAATLIGAYASQARADGPEEVAKIAGPAGHTVWRILRPRVNQAVTDYPQITFPPNSVVTVTASGCVQTGGHNATWKDYVDPVGPKSDTLYHGKLFIPGAMPAMERFSPTQPTAYTIPASVNVPASQMHLSLGYEDDGYSDNGYTAHDNGTGNQCWHVGDASVTIDIGPALPGPHPGPQADYVFTLESMNIRNLRSKNSDTDTVAVAVTIDGTTSGVAQQSLGDLKQGTHPLSFPISLEQVDSNNRIAIVYTVVNAGAGNAQQIAAGVSNLVGKLGASIPVVGSFLGAAASVFQTVFNLADADCDGPVVAGSLMGTGEDLAFWTQQGTLRRTTSFPGTDSATGCGANSYYDVTYSLAPDPNRTPRAYHIEVHSPTKTFTLVQK